LSLNPKIIILLIIILATATITQNYSIEKSIQGGKWSGASRAMIKKTLRIVRSSGDSKLEILWNTKIEEIRNKEDILKAQATRQPSSWYMLIDEPGYYELTQNIIDCMYEAAIYINASNVVLDGKGRMIDGVYNKSSKYGILVVNATNVTIRNTKIQEWYRYGIYLNDSDSNTIYNNTIQNNSKYGIYFKYSDNNTIYGNTIQNNDWEGIYLDDSDNNTIYGNMIQNNGDDGIDFDDSDNNTIYGNMIQNNNQYGIYFYYSYSNTIYGNTVQNNSYQGMCFSYSVNNTIYGNTIQNNSYQGMRFYFSGKNTIYGNTVQNNKGGIVIYQSDNNTIYGNTIQNNKDYGIYSKNSDNNKIYLNNFIDNTHQYTEEASAGRFYSPQPTTYIYGGETYTNYTGNYWSDYTGEDKNDDGIGETPYGPDQYPLMGKIGQEIIVGPTIKIVEPQDNTILNTTKVIVRWEIPQNTSPIDHHELYVDGFPVNTSIPPDQNSYTITLTEGTYTITARTVDRAGYVAEDIVKVIVDTTPPTVSITSPESGATLNTTTVTIAFVGGDDIGLDHYELYVDGSSVNTSIPPDQNSYTITLTEGTHAITVRAVDRAGNIAKDTIEITIIVETTTMEEGAPGAFPYLIVVVVAIIIVLFIAVVVLRRRSR